MPVPASHPLLPACVVSLPQWVEFAPAMIQTSINAEKMIRTQVIFRQCGLGTGDLH